MKKMVVILDCSTTSIYKNILNYTNNLVNREGCSFKFSQIALENTSVQILESFEKKAEFKHFLVRDRSSFFHSVSEEDLKFKEICQQNFLKNPDFMEQFNNTVKMPFYQELQVGKFKTNKSVDENIAFFKNVIDYEKPKI